MDRFTYTLERARLRVLEKLCEEARQNGETDSYADLVREVRRSQQRIQGILERYG